MGLKAVPIVGRKEGRLMLFRIYDKGLGTVHAGGANKARLKDRDIFDKKGEYRRYNSVI